MCVLTNLPSALTLTSLGNPSPPVVQQTMITMRMSRKANSSKQQRIH